MIGSSSAGRRRNGGLQLALIMGGIAALVIGGILLVTPNEPLLEMALSSEPVSGGFTIDEPTHLRVW